MGAYEIAQLEVGTKEDCTSGNCDRVLEYLDACPSLPDAMQEDDSTPWCSAFVNWCHTQAGVKGTGLANARSWLSFGNPVKVPAEGDIVILKRGGSPTAGHVGFFVQQIGDKIQVLGGNQGDSVKLSWYSIHDLLGYRRAA